MHWAVHFGRKLNLARLRVGQKALSDQKFLVLLVPGTTFQGTIRFHQPYVISTGTFPRRIGKLTPIFIVKSTLLSFDIIVLMDSG